MWYVYDCSCGAWIKNHGELLINMCPQCGREMKILYAGTAESIEKKLDLSTLYPESEPVLS